MPSSKEKFIADNDYTLSVVTTQRPTEDSSFKSYTTITRTFNFMAQQVTTHVRDALLGNAGGYKYGGAGSIANSVTQQHFDEFRSDAEIIFMHAKLKELGGNPPAIEEITRGAQKKRAGLTRQG